MTQYAGIVTQRDREIAEDFSKIADYKQKHFDKAKEIDKEREELGVPDYIVGKHIGQNRTQAYREYFELTGMMRDEILKNAEEIMESQVDVSNKIFTYDTLAKSDIANFSIGFMTSCCARLYGAGSGAMRGSIISKDMQPLVVKNDKDEIVAYSILYINREQGYAVLNNIEVSRKYDGKKEELKIIYEKMKRCAVENIEEYNKSAKVPVTKINSGTSPNWTAVNEYIRANPQSSSCRLLTLMTLNMQVLAHGRATGIMNNTQYGKLTSKRENKFFKGAKICKIKIFMKSG